MDNGHKKSLLDQLDGLFSDAIFDEQPKMEEEEKERGPLEALVEPLIQEVVAQEVVEAEPAVAEPLAEEPPAVEPVIEAPVAAEAVAAEPAVAEPLAEERPAVEPAIEAPIVEEAVEAEPAVAEPLAEEPPAVEPVIEAPVAEEAVEAEPAVAEPLAEEPPAVEPVIEAPVAEEAVAAEPAIAEPPVEKPPAVEPMLRRPKEESLKVAPVRVPAWEAMVREQRLKILNIMLMCVAVLGLLAISTTILQVVQEPSLLWANMPYFVAYAALVVVTFVRRLNPTWRIGVLVTLTYAVGIQLMIRGGPQGSGDLYLLVGPLLVSILVRQRVGAIFAGFSILTYAAIALLHRAGLLPRAEADLTQLSDVLDFFGNFAMLAAGGVLIQWMFNSALTAAVRRAEEKRAESARSEALLVERADELATANTLLQRRSAQFRTVAQVSQAAATVLDPEELMERAANLISQRFDLYHVGLFLIDDSGRQAVLRAATGVGGRELLARGSSLEVGDMSPVGRCTASGEAHVTSNALPRPSPLLPETLSAAALPLRSRGRVIGALDVQSTRPGAFSEEDITVLQTMADHVAVAIDNAQLLAETQARLEQVETLYRERFAPAPTRGVSIYERTQLDMELASDTMSPSVEKALARGETIVQSGIEDEAEQATLVAPIRLRGEVIGALGLQEEGDGRRWTSDEIALVEAVAEQMALAIENARLFQTVQQRAQRGRIVADVTTRVRASMDMETILQDAVRELGVALGTDRAFIRLGKGAQLPLGTSGTGILRELRGNGQDEQ